ncbi:MAG TPA: beta-galactosidase [Chloroflexi bacterium]|jgi:beta-galactosidase|nr:beta-galactosidase [Chloroflexota bacterium]
MINPKLPTIWYGADYNPDQWPEEIWHEDMRLMRLAHVNVATLPVFSWAHLQPAEDRYDFEWLDRILDLMAENGIYACLATSTAAHPAWMSRRFPDTLRVDRNGVRHKFGGRVNFCPSSPNYRHFSSELARRLAERYGDHPTLVAWHIANEYGNHCYCGICAEGFRRWLQARYGSLEALNRAWNTAFWSHQIYDWGEVETPTTNGEQRNQPMLLDYDRFQNDMILECYLGEYHVLKEITPDIPVTTNLMSHFKPLNYHSWAPHLDVVSWDSYPAPDEPISNVALRHELMRGLKGGQPFMLMEQSPSQTNWMPRNPLKAPGVMRLWSYQAVAHGADTIMFFQWRRSRGGMEKLHGAVIGHVGHEHTRVFDEVQALGAELEALGDTLLDSRQHARVALLFDWENWWALGYSSGPTVDLDYLEQIRKYYATLWEQNIATDVVSPSADLSQYDLVVAPVLYMLRPGVADNLKAFVDKGGRLLTTFFSGIVDENDLVTLGGYPGEIRDLMGIWAEEIDVLLPDESNRLVFSNPWGRIEDEYRCGMLCDLIHAESAQVLATYGDDFYAGRPALTVNRYGRGQAYYLAADPKPAFLTDFLGQLCDEMGIAAPLEVPSGVEVTQRHKEGNTYTFVLNHHAGPVRITLPRPAQDLLTGRTLGGDVELAGNDLFILRDL